MSLAETVDKAGGAAGGFEPPLCFPRGFFEETEGLRLSDLSSARLIRPAEVSFDGSGYVPDAVASSAVCE